MRSVEGAAVGVMTVGDENVCMHKQLCTTTTAVEEICCTKHAIAVGACAGHRASVPRCVGGVACARGAVRFAVSAPAYIAGGRSVARLPGAVASTRHPRSVATDILCSGVKQEDG